MHERVNGREAQGESTSEQDRSNERERKIKRVRRGEGERVVDVAMRYLARRSLTEGATRMEG